MDERTCAICGVAIYFEREPHWSGWLDVEYDDQLSYSPTLHDHTPEVGR